MQTVSMRLVTIVAESVVRDRLLREIESLGARGWTISDVGGRGSRGRRVGDVEGANVKIETLVTEAVAAAILDRLAERYFENYAAVAYVETVEVVRGDKYA